MKIDFSKKYGNVFGKYGQAQYFQDGKYFDSQGNLLADDGNPLKIQVAKVANPKVSDAGDDEKKLLVTRAKELGIKSPHLMGIDKLKSSIADREAEIDADLKASTESEEDLGLGGE
ncbi:hypothetical protein ED236_00480 [Pseudomethylobacillus aquaticus]|uniref:Uncharacterized protein n=1 Tax=Pseudomethylobacillus aquaticus TaxID=2676064 RepID=A0A3N0V602_9PROT|nr:hypothetical protein [Pseudomethylobacillus aquaticus]ROH88004.1 hypothetical protein ED236_00480 [Pseudomethylobacillus aquaticus]